MGTKLIIFHRLITGSWARETNTSKFCQHQPEISRRTGRNMFVTLTFLNDKNTDVPFFFF